MRLILTYSNKSTTESCDDYEVSFPKLSLGGLINVTTKIQPWTLKRKLSGQYPPSKFIVLFGLSHDMVIQWHRHYKIQFAVPYIQCSPHSRTPSLEMLTQHNLQMDIKIANNDLRKRKYSQGKLFTEPFFKTDNVCLVTRIGQKKILK